MIRQCGNCKNAEGGACAFAGEVSTDYTCSEHDYIECDHMSVNGLHCLASTKHITEECPIIRGTGKCFLFEQEKP